VSLEPDFTLPGFRTAAEVCETNAIVIGVSGDRGAGKTHFGASATSQGKVAFQILDTRPVIRKIENAVFDVDGDAKHAFIVIIGKLT